MKWQQRVRVATGLSCWQIMLHLLVVAVLVMGWMSGALVRVGLGLCVLYGVTLGAMLSRVLHNNLLLALAGLAILAGPAVVSLLAKDKNRYAKSFGLQQGGNAANPQKHR